MASYRLSSLERRYLLLLNKPLVQSLRPVTRTTFGPDPFPARRTHPKPEDNNSAQCLTPLLQSQRWGSGCGDRSGGAPAEVPRNVGRVIRLVHIVRDSSSKDGDFRLLDRKVELDLLLDCCLAITRVSLPHVTRQ
jgi:hypothetical protein